MIIVARRVLLVAENVRTTVSPESGDVARSYRLFVVWEAAAVLRHDLRNKLASVRNAAFYLRRRVEGEAAELCAHDPRVPKFFAMIGTELDGAETIISERLPGLADPTTGDAVGIAGAVAAAIAELRVPVGVSLSAPDGDLRVRADRAELAVAIFCLLENAVDAITPAGGQIAVTLRAEAGRAIVAVDDDGPGLPDEPRRVLEHFFTTRPGRLGLGLKIARRIAQRARGSLDIVDREGRGVRASLALPMAEGADAGMHDPARR